MISAGVAAGLYYFFSAASHRSAAPSGNGRTLAVIPFQTIGNESAEEGWGLGMADALIIKLSAMPQIRVRPTSAVARYDATMQSPLDAGRRLKADAILEGQIQKTGSRIRVTVQLVGSKDGATLWAEKFDHDSTDIFALEDAISERVAEKLLPELTDADKKALTKIYTQNPEAQQLYLKGRYFADRDTEDDLRKGIEYFQQAADRDPRYALAYAGIANAYCELVIQAYLSPAEAFGKAKIAADKALELDENLAETHSALGTVAWAHDWNWSLAEREYRRALQLNENSPAAHSSYAFYLISINRKEEALGEINRALELDPVSLSVTQELAFINLTARRYDDAALWFQRSLELNSGALFSRALLAATYAAAGKQQEAVEQCKHIPIGMLGPKEQLVAAYTGFAYARSAQPAESHVILERMEGNPEGRYIDPYLIAGIYAGLHEREQAFRLLDRAFQERSMSMVFLMVEPFFIEIHSDPRFAGLVRRVGFPSAGS